MTGKKPHQWIGIKRSEFRDTPGGGLHLTVTETGQSFSDYSFTEGHETVAVSGGNDLTVRLQLKDDW